MNDHLERLIGTVRGPSGHFDWTSCIVALGNSARLARLCADAYHGDLNAALTLQQTLLPGWRMDALWQGGTMCPTESGWSCRIRCVTEQRQAVGSDERTPFDLPSRACLYVTLKAWRDQAEPPVNRRPGARAA